MGRIGRSLEFCHLSWVGRERSLQFGNTNVGQPVAVVPSWLKRYPFLS
jgi:hypothetical protein